MGKIKVTAKTDKANEIIKRVKEEAGKQDRIMRILGFREEVVSERPYCFVIRGVKNPAKNYPSTYMKGIVEKQMSKLGLTPVADFDVEVVK